MTHGRWWRGAVAAAAVAGCIPEPVLRPRDAAVDARDAADVTDVSGTDAGDAAQDAGGRASARLLRPLSFSVVGTQLPELRWELPAGASGARVEVCADRDCARVEHAADAMGGMYRVTESLRAGAHFWRVRARYGTELGPPSATWEFLVQGSSSAMSLWYGFVDVDRDGVADIVVGAPQANAGRGGVLIWRGKDEPSRGPVLTLDAPGSQVTEFGRRVSLSSDFDGDGLADLAVLSAFNGLADSRVTLFSDPLNEVTPTPRGTLLGSVSGFSGLSVMRALGDVNGDGFGDLGIGATSASDSRGEVLVFLGGPSGLSGDRVVAVRAEVPSQSRFGSELFPVGDVDSDGFDDMVVGADQSMETGGRAFLVRGRANFVTQAVSPTELDVGSASAPGRHGSSIGDIDRDGRPNFVLSAAEGQGLLYRSPVSGAPSALLLEMSNTGCPKLGSAYVGGFDFNGDQLADFAALCTIMPMRSEVYFYTGPTLPPTRLPLTFPPPTGVDARDTLQMSSYGDFNADGLADIVTATPASDAGPTILAVHLGTRTAMGGTPLMLEFPAGFGVNDPLVFSR